MGGGLRATMVAICVGSMAAGAGGAAFAQEGSAGAPVYYLPAPAGTPLLITQGNDTDALGGDHAGVSRFAYDLAISSGASFPVVAARPGVVESVRSDVADGNCPDAGEADPPPCWTEVNHVVIDHLDGTAALYLHLAPVASAELEPGQAVERGQLLGAAGSSGWASGTMLHFMVMGDDAPAGDDPAWWRQSTGPIAFADASVLAVHPDGVPGTGLVAEGPFTSANPGPADPVGWARPDARDPLPLPGDLPGRLPWAAGTAHSVRETKASARDGFGFEVAAGGRGAAISEATEVYPLFPGVLRYAGCATGAGAPRGRVVVVEHTLGGHTYQAVYSHLSSLDPSLGEPFSELGPNQPLGTFGSTVTAPDGSCEGSDGRGTRLHVGVLQDAVVTPAGEIGGGRVVRPWPLLGEGSYDPVRWWKGPMVAADVLEAATGPTGRWSSGTTRDGGHLSFGQPVELSVRAEGEATLREVRLLARHADWAQSRKGRFRGLDPERTWRLLAVCRPTGTGGVPGTTRGCRWDGGARSATISYRWDPTVAESRGRAPWLPPANAAIGRGDRDCAAVTLAFEVSDASGRRSVPNKGKVARRCDARASGLGRTVYLDPLEPPAAPTAVRLRCTEESPFGCVGWVVSWQHPGANVDGFRIHVERVEASALINNRCKFADRTGPWLAKTLPAGNRKWPVDVRSVHAPPEGTLGKGWRILAASLSISAYNAAGVSARMPVPGDIQTAGDILC